MGRITGVLYQHPLTTIYIDDDAEWLSMLPASVGAVPYKTFREPRAALQQLEAWRERHGELDARALAPRISSAADGEQVIGMDTWMLYLRVFERQRFARVGVVVVDYEMPGMSGLAVCRALEGTGIKRLMLSGRGGPHLAIQAFNDGLIDCYLEKSHPDLGARVAEALADLQFRYFADQSRTLFGLLKRTDPAWASATLWTLFEAHCRGCGAVEHYLIGEPRGMLVVDQAGQGHLWLVYTDADIDAHCQTARRLGAPDGVIARMEARSAVTRTHGHDGVLSHDTWWRSLLSLSPVPGDGGIYYGVTKDPSPFSINETSVLSLTRYLEAA